MRNNLFVGWRCKKWQVSILFIFILSISFLFAQVPSISRMEYYLDIDPGYGKATNFSFSGTTNATGNINIDLVPLSQGVHLVGVRSMDANGAWSHDSKWLFVKPFSTIASIQPNISLVEWYLDTDPGYGKATNLAIASANDIPGLSFNIDMVPLSQGVHIVGVRSKDTNGAWSHDNKWLFVKPYITFSATQPDISRVEWYLDHDPGYGNGTPLAISSAENIPGLSFNIDMVPLEQGVHIIGVRSMDANGSWSLDNKWIFLKPYVAGGNSPVPDIVKMEYFVDIDPGYGKASPINITPGNDLGMLIFNANISNVDYGVHKLGIRSLDANGAWSLDNKVDFTGGAGTIWIGVTSTAWNTPTNWAKGLVPTIQDNVVIPAGTPFSPLISIGDNAICKSIKLNPGAVVNLATGAGLKVNQ